MPKSKLQMVKEFNNEIIKLSTVKLAKCLPPQRAMWFKGVMHEEVDEFIQAHKKGDCVGILDALVDMAYFLLGRVQECGFTEHQWDEAFRLVHEANMTKKRGNKGRGSDADAIKDSTWVGPEELLQELLQEDGYYQVGKHAFNDLDEMCFPKNPMTQEEIDAMVYGTKEEKEACFSKDIKEITADPQAIMCVQHRGPSVYMDLKDGTQVILSEEEIELYSKMSPVFKEVTQIAIKKSKDYNNGNGQPTSRAQYFPFGLLSYAQMLHTKAQRLNSLAQQAKAPNNESIRDTLLDMINYATFAVEAIDKGEI